MPPKKVSIYSLELNEFQFPYFTIACEVSSGLYVRSLAHDIGEKLAVGATVTAVRRTRVGPYHVEQAKNLDEILAVHREALPFSDGCKLRQYLRLESCILYCDLIDWVAVAVIQYRQSGY